MRRQISLKWFVILSFLSLGVLLVIGYSFLTVQYYIRGMDSITANNMEHVVHAYVDRGGCSRRRECPGDETRSTHFRGFLITSSWADMPQEVRERFGAPPQVPGQLYKHTWAHWPRHPEVFYFAMVSHYGGQTRYILHTVQAREASRALRMNIRESMRTLLLISIGSALALGLILWLLLRRVSQPLAALGRWTRELDAEGLRVPAPDFGYPELNRLAERIRTSLSSVQETLAREHAFLRHTSHELRTPISVIRSNLELIRKLEENLPETPDARLSQSLARIDRASLNMQHLTETLLWLSRDVAEAPQTGMVDLDQLVRQVVGEMRYLLRDKSVTVELHTSPYVAQLPEVPARIVLGNLVRNAFQHTWEGEVRIRQHAGEIEIVNRQRDGALEEPSLGFGLGLQLTAQLTERLGWEYRNEAGSHGHRVWLRLGS